MEFLPHGTIMSIRIKVSELIDAVTGMLSTSKQQYGYTDRKCSERCFKSGLRVHVSMFYIKRGGSPT